MSKELILEKIAKVRSKILYMLCCGEFPEKLDRCQDCFDVIVNDADHICGERRPRSLRTKIIAKETLKIFEMKIGSSHQIAFFDMKSKTFKPIQKFLLCSKIDGLFTIMEDSGFTNISYDAFKMRYFSFLVVILDENWHPWFRAVLTESNGFVLFKINSDSVSLEESFDVPSQLKLNTALVLGIRPNPEELKIDFRIYIDACGNIVPARSDGWIMKSVVWNSGNETNLPATGFMVNSKFTFSVGCMNYILFSFVLELV